MIIIEEQIIDLTVKKKDSYPDIRNALGRTGIKIRHRSIQSDNYVAGTTGWIIRANGTIEAITIVAGAYITSFVQSAIPTSLHIGDLWIKTDDNNKVYRAESVGADAITAGEWVEYGTLANWSELVDDDSHKPADDADVTNANTANDTDNVNAKASVLVQERAEHHYIKGYFEGSMDDGLTETVAVSGSITRKLLDSYLRSATNGLARLYSGEFGILTDDWDTDYELHVRLATSNPVADGGGSNAGSIIFFGLLDGSTTIPWTRGDNGIVLTTRHAGFFISRDSKVYASIADGTTQQTSEITGITFTNVNNYKIVFDAGTSVKFYVNDVLKATLSTNVPTGSTNKPDIHFQVKAREDGGEVTMKTYNNYKVISL